jgi:hypothetical protein
VSRRKEENEPMITADDLAVEATVHALSPTAKDRQGKTQKTSSESVADEALDRLIREGFVDKYGNLTEFFRRQPKKKDK